MGGRWERILDFGHKATVVSLIGITMAIGGKIFFTIAEMKKDLKREVEGLKSKEEIVIK
jgi:hypothetical protein